jgi:YHS domain-containing protein
MRIAPCVAFALLALALPACGKKEEPAPAAAPKRPERPRDRISWAKMPPTAGYPLKTCVVTGKDLAAAGASRFVIAYKGYELQFCSEDCLDTFATDPEGYVRKMNPKAMFDK